MPSNQQQLGNLYINIAQNLYDKISLWNGNACEKMHRMFANQTTNMAKREHFMRRQDNNSKSGRDAKGWTGYKACCVLPLHVTNLMQLGIIMCGPYVLKLLKHFHMFSLLNQDFCSNSMIIIQNAFV